MGARLAAVLFFVALWTGNGQAVISWDTPGRACLWRNETFIDCYEGPARVTLGGPNTDAAYRPAGGDILTLAFDDGTVVRTELRARPVYLSMIRR